QVRVAAALRRCGAAALRDVHQHHEPDDPLAGVVQRAEDRGRHERAHLRRTSAWGRRVALAKSPSHTVSPPYNSYGAERLRRGKTSMTSRFLCRTRSALLYLVTASSLTACITIGRSFPTQGVPSVAIGRSTQADIQKSYGSPFRTRGRGGEGDPNF